MRLIFLSILICVGLALAIGAVCLLRKRRRQRKRARHKRLSEFTQLVGMTSGWERDFVRQYAARDYTGEGAIVDLGCWLGSFSLPLAIGLRENPRVSAAKTRIHAYDLFSWQNWMNPCVAGTHLDGRYKDGDNFMDAFVEQIAPVADLVAVHAGDLNEEQWDAMAPIEFLLIDAMKSWELTNSVIRNFFPALVPGLSLVHHQDFVHFFTPWIHLMMFRFRQYFEPRIYVPEGSYIFAYRERIPPELLNKEYSFADFTAEEAGDAFEYSLSLVPAVSRTNVYAARIMMQVHLQDWGGARVEMERVLARGVVLEKEMLLVAKLLDEQAAKDCGAIG